MEVTNRNNEVKDQLLDKAREEEYRHALPTSAFPEKRAAETWKDVIRGLDWWLILCFFLWYAQNALYVVFNKKFLNSVRLPWTLSACQLMVGWIFMVLFWGFKLRERPHFEDLRKFFITFMPMGLLHFLVHVGSVVSMGLGAISFTHVVKALEPVITVLLSMVCLREFMNIYAYLALIPVVAGVALASMKELEFSLASFLFAMLSNVTGALRSIFAKLTMKNKAEIGENLTASNINLILTLIASVMALPFVIAFEAQRIIPVWVKATAKMSTSEKAWVLGYGFLSSVFYFTSNDSAFYCLGKINQVTYSVANTAKRVLLITTSIIVFANPVNNLGYVGMTMAVLGTLLYSLVK